LADLVGEAAHGVLVHDRTLTIAAFGTIAPGLAWSIPVRRD
jgi:hypothetical protein